jgi:hypothetical protein
VAWFRSATLGITEQSDQEVVLFPAALPPFTARNSVATISATINEWEYVAKVFRQLDVFGPRLPRMRTLFDAQDALLEILTAVADNRIDLNRAGTHPLRSSANLSVTAEGRASPKKTNVQALLSQCLPIRRLNSRACAEFRVSC